MPSLTPSIRPTTMIPSAIPSIMGAVASVSISGSTTEDISSDDIDQITSDLSEIYGVDSSEIEITVDYVASGNLNITIPEGVSEVEAIASLEKSISDVLGVHSSDVIITIDVDGTVTYSVIGATYAEADAIQNSTAQDNFASRVNADLADSDSTIVVESLTSNDDVEVMVSATVDTTDATGTVDRVDAIENLADEYGFTDSSAQGNKNFFIHSNYLQFQTEFLEILTCFGQRKSLKVFTHKSSFQIILFGLEISRNDLSKNILLENSLQIFELVK